MNEDVKKRLAEKVWDFDVYALVDVLVYYGLDLGVVRLKGHVGFESQPRLIKEISFGGDGNISIVFYFGLAGANSPLPTYFFDMVDKGIINELHFIELIGFLDEVMLRVWLNALYPEKFRLQIGVGVTHSRWLQAMGSLCSLSSLLWIFQLALPELQIRAERNQVKAALSSSPAIVGRSKIGLQMVLGDSYPIMLYCNKITYIADDELFSAGIPWHIEIKKRLESMIFPVLKAFEMFFEVWLVIRESKAWLTLDSGSGFIGYERLKGRENENKTILIHKGIIDLQS
jgi:hypothetical protein